MKLRSRHFRSPSPFASDNSDNNVSRPPTPQSVPQLHANNANMSPPTSPQVVAIAFGSFTPIQRRRVASAPAPMIATHISARGAEPRAPQLHTPNHTPLAPELSHEDSVNLVWQVMHGTNVLSSQLHAYLSLETLDRKARAFGWTTPVLQTPIMEAQMAMMVDSFKNLSVAVGMLRGTGLHLRVLENASYLSLMQATKGIAAVMGVIRNGRIEKTAAEVDALRIASDDLTELCHGNLYKQIAGWRGVWDAVKGMMSD